MELKIPGQGEIDEMPSTPTFFPTNPEKLKRKHAILDATYDIPTTMEGSEPICLVSIVTNLHGAVPVIICKKKTRVKDASFIVKHVPNGNKLSTRVVAPLGRLHTEYYEGTEECPTYHSTLRLIYVSRMRMFSNLQHLPEIHFLETEKDKFFLRDNYNEDRSEYSEKGLAYLRDDLEFKETLENPHYGKYFSEKDEYLEKVLTSKPKLLESDLRNSELFGIYIDVAIIRPDAEKSRVTVKTFILSNKSEDFSLKSIGYINKLLVGGDPKIKEDLKEFIESGVCKLSTVIEAISSYTHNKGVSAGNTKIFLTDLACSEYKTFVDTPRNKINIEKPTLDLIDFDEINKERTRKLFEDNNIPSDYPDEYLNEDGTGYDAGCGVLYFDEIESAKISKSEAEKREYDKIFEILRSKMPELRSRVAAGLPSYFNKKRRTKRRTKRRETKRRQAKRRETKRRETKRRQAKRDK